MNARESSSATATRPVMPDEAPIHETIPYADPDLPLVLRWARLSEQPRRQVLADHAEIELHYVRRGGIAYTVRDKHFHLRPGSLLIVYPNEPHGLRTLVPGTPVEKITFIGHPALFGMKSSGRLAHPSARHARLAAPERSEVLRIAAGVAAEFSHHAADWKILCRLRMRELALLCKRAFAAPLAADRGDATVEAVLTHLDTHFAEALEIRDLAALAGMSGSRLMHLFQEHMGLGIKRYILLRRVAKACEWLRRDPEAKIEWITRIVGFRYFADFNRVFKQHTGLTAAAYRASARYRHQPVAAPLLSSKTRRVRDAPAPPLPR